MDKQGTLQSKKFKAAIVGAGAAGVTEFIIVLLGEYGIVVAQEAVLYVLSPFLAYIGAQGIADFSRYKHQVTEETKVTKLADMFISNNTIPSNLEDALPEYFFDGEPVDVEDAMEDILEEVEIEDEAPEVVVNNWWGIAVALKQELEAAGKFSNFNWYSRFAARVNSYDLRQEPKKLWIEQSQACVDVLINILKRSFADFINYPVPQCLEDIGSHPRDLLYQIKTSTPCGKYVGETERVHVRGLWRRFKQLVALDAIASKKIDWKKKYGTSRVTPLMIARAARRGAL